MFSVIAPVCAPVLAVLALWSAVGHWNAWFDALLYVSDRDKLVLQLVLRRILTGGPSDIGDLNIQMFQGTMLETVKAATIMVTIGPIILVYPFVQRSLDHVSGGQPTRRLTRCRAGTRVERMTWAGRAVPGGTCGALGFLPRG